MYDGVTVRYSGTTAVAMLMRDNHVWVANAGDSRAVCATRVARAAAAGASPAKSKRASKDGAGVLEPGPSGLAAKDLSVDQNPDSPGETERGAVSPDGYSRSWRRHSPGEAELAAAVVSRMTIVRGEEKTHAHFPDTPAARTAVLSLDPHQARRSGFLRPAAL